MDEKVSVVQKPRERLRRSPEKSNGVPGNFTVQEAIQIAKSSNIQLLVPCHFGMFDFNTIDKTEIVNAFERNDMVLKSVIPEAGKQYNIYVEN